MSELKKCEQEIIRDVRIRVIYKSGAVQEFDCTSFTVRKALGGTREVIWENAIPKPLEFGLDEVAAMWRVAGAEVEA